MRGRCSGRWVPKSFCVRSGKLVACGRIEERVGLELAEVVLREPFRRDPHKVENENRIDGNVVDASAACVIGRQLEDCKTLPPRVLGAQSFGHDGAGKLVGHGASVFGKVHHILGVPSRMLYAGTGVRPSLDGVVVDAAVVLDEKDREPIRSFQLRTLTAKYTHLLLDPHVRKNGPWVQQLTNP